jgi:hypothetical protein
VNPVADTGPRRAELVEAIVDSIDCAAPDRAASDAARGEAGWERLMIRKAAFAGAAAIFALSALAIARSEAADKNDKFNVRGLGTKTCSEYLETRNLNAKETDKYADWLTGFLTAYNWLKPDTYDITASQYNQKGLLKFLDLYCGQSPKKRIIDAAIGLTNSIYAKRTKVGS